MTVYHVFYIPAVLFVGVFLGTLLGRKQIRLEIAEQERAAREREARKEARAARRRERADQSSSSTIQTENGS